MKATSPHSGFGIVEGILIVVVLAIIVGLGYVFINRPSSKPDSAASTSSQASAETSSIQGELDSMNIDATLDTTDIDTALE